MLALRHNTAGHPLYFLFFFPIVIFKSSYFSFQKNFFVCRLSINDASPALPTYLVGTNPWKEGHA